MEEVRVICPCFFFCAPHHSNTHAHTHTQKYTNATPRHLPQLSPFPDSPTNPSQKKEKQHSQALWVSDKNNYWLSDLVSFILQEK